MATILKADNLEKVYRIGKVDVPALRGVSVAVQEGEFVAVMGPSGCGKSTMLHLLGGLLTPTKGRILIDGIDLNHVRLDSYRDALGVVLQESFLFDGTIRENVAFSRPNASEEEIRRVCRIARVDVSVDGGKSWQKAALERPVLAKCLTRFRFPWTWEGGPRLLQSRAVDDTGYVQPSRSQLVTVRGLNSYYHNNSIQSWQVVLAARYAF